MGINCRGERAEYACHKGGCVRIVKADLDQFIVETLLDYLAQDDVVAQLRASDEADSEEVAPLRGELADVEAEHRELGADVGAGRLSRELAAMAEPGILRRMDQLRAKIKDRMCPDRCAG